MSLVRNLDLEAAIVASPTSWELFAVYGDWLTQRGDPRGPIMVAEAEILVGGHGNEGSARATALKRAVGRLWRAAEAEIAGRLRGFGEHGLELEWRLGCIHGATLTVPQGDAGTATLGHLLAHPAAFALSRLVVILASAQDHGFSFQPLVDQIADDAPITLRDLALGDVEGSSGEASVVLGDLRPLFARHSALRALALAGRASTVSAPSWGLHDLSRLALRPIGMSWTWWRALTAESWPRLRRLHVSYASALDDDIQWLRTSRIVTRLPRLTHLGVAHLADAKGVVEALAATELSRQLIELDLRFGRFDDEGLRALEEERDAFPNLSRLVLGQAEPSLTERLSWLELS